MAARNKPYDQFGPYLLFKKLESDSLGELWRAGRIDGSQLGPTVALRRLTGGSRDAMAAAASAAQHVVPQLHGTSFAKDQVVGVIDGVPYIAHDYAGGRSLRHIIDKARGSNGSTPNPVPLDQAIAIAEKVALSLATTGELRDGNGNRLSHGGLIPQFIWISDDGEIRVAGQQLGAGLVASFADARVAADIGRYFSPEYRMNGNPSKSSEVWALGAILFLILTGQEPPDAMTASAFAAAVRAAKTMGGAPIPDDLRIVLDKSFNIDASMRYASLADMKQALAALANSGKYTATTFNLAFYLSSLLKKEMEGEVAEREKESKVNLAPYLEPKPAPPPGVVMPPFDAPPAVAATVAAPVVPAPAKSRMPMAIAAAVTLAVVGVGGFFMMKKQPVNAAPVEKVAAASTLPVAQPRVISEPVLATPTTSTTPETTATLDPAAQKKAFEDAVRQRMEAEMMKLQQEFTQQLKQQQSRNAPVASAPAANDTAEEERLRVAELESQRREAELRRQETTTQAAQQAATQTVPALQPQTQTTAPQLTQSQPPATSTQPAAPTVREGDVIEVLALDEAPRMTRPLRPQYPPMAARQKVEGSVVVSALISENGDVLDVRILRGLGSRGLGIDDAAVRAMRSAKFTPPMKNGKRVRTWFPQTIMFKP